VKFGCSCSLMLIGDLNIRSSVRFSVRFASHCLLVRIGSRIGANPIINDTQPASTRAASMVQMKARLVE
jgi:hypothetical protein